LAGEAMDTLKLKIFNLKKENTEEATKLAAAEKAKEVADERITIADKKIKELSKQIHTRKLLLDENTDKLSKNTTLTKRKEEAIIAAKEEIKASTAREMQLTAEVEKVSTALPSTQAKLLEASQLADKQLSEVKKLEIRSMLNDQTIEEMEQQLSDAHNMSNTTLAKAEEMTKKLSIRSTEFSKAEKKAETAASKLEDVNDDLRKADRKMAGMQFSLEDKCHKESKYKKQLLTLQQKLANAEQRSARDEEALHKLKERMEVIAMRRKAKEDEKHKKKKFK